MRWATLRPQTFMEPEELTGRIVEGFLFFPMALGGQWRWLEKTSWIEVYRPGKGSRPPQWVPVAWN